MFLAFLCFYENVVENQFIAVFLNSSVPIVLVASLIAYRVPYDFVFILLGIVGLFSSDKLLRLMSNVLPLKAN